MRPIRWIDQVRFLVANGNFLGLFPLASRKLASLSLSLTQVSKVLTLSPLPSLLFLLLFQLTLPTTPMGNISEREKEEEEGREGGKKRQLRYTGNETPSPVVSRANQQRLVMLSSTSPNNVSLCL